MAGIVMFGKNSNTGPSPGLWGLAPRDVMYDKATAYGMSWPIGLPVMATTAAVISGGSGWIGFGDTGAAAVSGQQDDELGGAYAIASDADNEGASISGGVAPFVLTKAAQDFFFEARVKVSATTTLDIGFFVGLMDTTACTNAIPITQAGALADVNAVGFQYIEADTVTFDTIYKADGVTAVQVKDAAGAIAAATYLKLGMLVQKGVLTFFLNGVPLADTKTLPDATGTDFPADVNLRPVVAMLHGTGQAGDMTTSWLHAYQLRA